MCSLQGSALRRAAPPARSLPLRGEGRAAKGLREGTAGDRRLPSRIRVAAACCCCPAGRGEASPGPPAPEAGRAGPRLRSRRPPLAASLPPSFLPLQPPRTQGSDTGAPRVFSGIPKGCHPCKPRLSRVFKPSQLRTTHLSQGCKIWSTTLMIQQLHFPADRYLHAVFEEHKDHSVLYICDTFTQDAGRPLCFLLGLSRVFDRLPMKVS
ncbi:uncharacterized protein LOC118252172 [Cygnus atratus]|uniref:uncharacterized protein LOC118252172 n=1 Tax=Cygnus atratus TaxID=8868 RepID=UPI0015D5AC58|nr:uncharacterized protein LOC118252172 [Cygnus atratus]